jgi:polar amino acid transport system substrate-binding protein
VNSISPVVACILDGQFTGIQQVITTQKPHLEAIEFLSACIEEFITTGLVTALIQKYQVQGLSVALLTKKS